MGNRASKAEWVKPVKALCCRSSISCRFLIILRSSLETKERNFTRSSLIRQQVYCNPSPAWDDLLEQIRRDVDQLRRRRAHRIRYDMVICVPGQPFLAS